MIAGAYVAAGELLRSSPARAETALFDAFSAGSVNARVLRDIAARADDHYQDVLIRFKGERRPPALPHEIPRLSAEVAQPPGWVGSFLALASRYAELPNNATDVLRFADTRLYGLLGASVSSDVLAAIDRVGG